MRRKCAPEILKLNWRVKITIGASDHRATAWVPGGAVAPEDRAAAAAAAETDPWSLEIELGFRLREYG